MFNESDYYNEERIFNADELCFVISDGAEIGAVGPVVLLCPHEFWKNTGHIFDSLGGHNVNREDLDNVGLSEFEIIENYFEVKDEGSQFPSDEEIRYTLEDAGFIWDDDFVMNMSNTCIWDEDFED
ncbi:MAG TPA: hypothetical protein P5509_09135 [Bacteroidales bacterium]|nr:hypothetical protein [Bacteroidales bacterium]